MATATDNPTLEPLQRQRVRRLIHEFTLGARNRTIVELSRPDDAGKDAYDRLLDKLEREFRECLA